MSKLFYTTFTVLFVLHCVESYFIDLTPVVEPFAQTPPKADFISSLVSLITGILSFLCALPLTVSIIRNVVGDEPFYESLFEQVFAWRQMRYVLMIIIISLISIPFLVLLGILGGVAFMAQSAVIKLFFVLLFVACLPLFIYVLFRYSLATTLAVLDKESPLQTSWELMRGNILLLFLSSFALGFILMMILMPLGLIIILPAAFLPTSMFVIIYGFFQTVSQLLVALPLSALAGYFYLAVTNTEAFEEE